MGWSRVANKRRGMRQSTQLEFRCRRVGHLPGVGPDAFGRGIIERFGPYAPARSAPHEIWIGILPHKARRRRVLPTGLSMLEGTTFFAVKSLTNSSAILFPRHPRRDESEPEYFGDRASRFHLIRARSNFSTPSEEWRLRRENEDIVRPDSQKAMIKFVERGI